MKKLVTNGRVWLDEALRPASILIDEAGKIAALLDPEQVINAEEVIDASGCLVLPGGIDMHTHIQDGAETFYEGTCAAAVGGITTAIDIPPFHVCSTRQGCERRREHGERECVIDFGLSGGIVVTHEDLIELDEVARFGAPYFKVFMPSDPPVDTALLWASVQAAARTGLRLALHAEEVAILDAQVDWDDPLGFPHSRPAVAETSATAQVLEMARAAGAPVHICHVSAGRTAELVQAYQAWGAEATGETTPHFLLLDENEFQRQGASVKTTPPLRNFADIETLWQALDEGVLEAVVSDHYLGAKPQPGKPPESMQAKEAGIAGLELSLPLLYHEGVETGRISLARFVQLTSTWPAELLKLSDRKGRIALGMDADLVILDLQANWKVAPAGPFSRISTTPYQGWELGNRVRRTMVRGATIWDGSTIQADRGFGKYQASRRNA